MDLRDLFSEVNPLSPRYVLALILQLPTGGAFYASRRGGTKFRGWDESMYARVATVNAIRATNHILMMVNRDPKKKRPAEPEMFPTPDDDETKAIAPKRNSFAAVVAQMKEAQTKKELLNA